MIKNSTFCALLAQRLGFTLYEDRGEYIAALREHNEIIAPICGVFRMNPLVVTPIQGLFLAQANAAVEIAADKKTLAQIRSTVDALAEKSGETFPLEDDEGKTFIVTVAYSTAYVGTERSAPNNIGTVIPVNMTVNYTVIENGVSSNDVRLYLDGHPVFVTEFSVNHQRVADSYAITTGIANTVTAQSIRSFDFISPLLHSDLGKLYRRSVWDDDANTAHCFTMQVDGDTYAYIVTFGNTSASGQQPQNVGCNVSLMSAPPEVLSFGDGWQIIETDLNTDQTHTLTAAEYARKIVFWGDNTFTVWDCTKSLENISHVYPDRENYVIRIFTEDLASAPARTPDLSYTFYADGDMTVSLFTDDAKSNGFWRRDCTIDWGDGTATDYNTMTATFDEPHTGISHTYAEKGSYTIKIYNNDDPLWISA